MNAVYISAAILLVLSIAAATEMLCFFRNLRRSREARASTISVQQVVVAGTVSAEYTHYHKDGNRESASYWAF